MDVFIGSLQTCPLEPTNRVRSFDNASLNAAILSKPSFLFMVELCVSKLGVCCGKNRILSEFLR